MLWLLPIIVIFIGLSLMILLHEAGHFLVARWFGLRIEEFGFGLPPRLFGKKIGETIYSINWLPFGGFVKIYGEDGVEKMLIENSGDGVNGDIADPQNFRSRKAWQRALIIVAGVIMNFILGWLIVATIFWIGTKALVVITEVQDGTPAAQAGLMVGDILSVLKSDAEELILNDASNVSEVVAFINRHQGREIFIKIQRGGDFLELVVIPRVDPPAGQGSLGVALTGTGSVPQSLPSAIGNGLITSFRIVSAIVISLANLVTGLLTGADLGGVVGPVGVIQIASQSSQLGFIYLIQLLGLISLNLAVINIIPFPALDGGRLFFILLEKLRGKPIATNTEMIVHRIGFMVLLLMMVFITMADVGRLL